MKIIDRYLLRQFIHVFVICFISLTGLYVRCSTRSAIWTISCVMREQKGSLLSVMGEFYFYQVDRILRAAQRRDLAHCRDVHRHLDSAAQ